MIAPLTFLLLVIVPVAAAARQDVLELKWAQLGPVIANQEITVILQDQVRLEGTVTGVGNDSLSLTIRTGQRSLPRKAIAEIRLKKVQGHGRLLGAAGLGAAGTLGALGWSLSENRVGVSDSSRVAAWVAISAGSTAAGYFIGRAIDTRRTVIKLLPD